MPSHVGQVIMSTTLDTAAKVQKIYGGTWERWGAGKVPVGVDPNDTDFNAPNKSGGSKTVTLTKDQMPSHSHTCTTAIGWQTGGGSSVGRVTTNNGNWNGWGTTINATGGDQPHENMPPFLTLYMWRRTA